jgi:glycosyltransferase involved in cell wall biosynthesis
LERLVIERDPLSPVSCVQNSVDLDAFSRPRRSKQEIPTVGFIYSEPRFKGTDLVLRAIDNARLTIPNLRVLGFGTSSPTHSMPLPKGCDYVKCPPQAEIPNIYAACDAWLVLSRFEGFGLPLLEAMACRTPVIASPAGAAREVLAGGGGILVPTEDYLHAADAIVHFANLRDDEWKIISEAAFSTVIQYTWNDAAVLFEAALEQAIAPEG